MENYDETALGVGNIFHPANQKESAAEYTQEEMMQEDIDRLERNYLESQRRVMHYLEIIQEVNELTTGNLSVSKIKEIKKIVEPFKKAS